MKKRGPKPLSWYRETFIRSGYRCAYCGKNLINDFEAWMGIEVDHIVPISKGGTDKLTNRIAACSVCNGEKGRYLHPNHETMTTQQILQAAKKYVRMKRSAWHEVYIEAIEEFRKKRLSGSPVLIREGQPQLQNHRPCGSASGGSEGIPHKPLKMVLNRLNPDNPPTQPSRP